MSLYKFWSSKKCPDFKFVKSNQIGTKGDVFIVSDSKAFVLECAKPLLEDWQFKKLKTEVDKKNWSFKTESNHIFIYIPEDKMDQNVGGFESCDYYTFKKFFGENINANEVNISLLVDKDFVGSELVVSAFSESTCSVAYDYKKSELKDLQIGLDSKYHALFQNHFVKAQAVNFARFLVDLPPNELNPTTYAELIKDMVGTNKNFKVETISKDLEKKGYGLIHAVGKGSVNLPQLVRVISQSSNKKTALVGKGITFDTGGLDIKPSQFMRNMKKDMGGSAVVAGILYYYLAIKKVPDVDFYFALAENSVGGNSFRPGDVYTAGNGLTVEIDNTDAEGRLALADALSWLSKEKKQPDTVIDIATLTGAIKVGLGSYVAGLFSNDKKLSDSLLDSSLKSGDFIWSMPMPFWTEGEMTKSDVADLVNSSKTGYGGAITAAQFLKFFVPKKTKWAHLDIYAWVDSKRDALRQSGGSGQGVMLLLNWLDK